MKITFDNKMVLNHKFKMVRRVLFYSPILMNVIYYQHCILFIT